MHVSGKDTITLADVGAEADTGFCKESGGGGGGLNLRLRRRE